MNVVSRVGRVIGAAQEKILHQEHTDAAISVL